MPLAYIILSSKTEEIYNKVFNELLTLIYSYTNRKTFEGIKIKCDFELSIHESIKKIFDGCLLDGCYFHYGKAI